MKSLIIEASSETPYYPAVNFDGSNGVCEISGESYMEESYKFYTPLINWIRTYSSEFKKPITLNIRLSYFNTSSSRLILDMLDLLRKYKDSGGNAQVNWYYDPEDPDVKDEVEDFEIESGIDIQMIRNDL